jgi:hypothetical protein
MSVLIPTTERTNPQDYFPQTTHNNHIAGLKSVNAFMNFEEGLSREKLRKIEMRKDAVMLLNLKNKFDLIYEQNYLERDRKISEDKRKKRMPFCKLANGKNLFTQNISKLKNLYEVYEMSFEELYSFDLDFVSFLPSLGELKIKFSQVNFGKTTFEGNFFPSLLHLELPCNDLNNEILDYLKSSKSLKFLNLSGNKITGNIPDLSNMKSLEELNLSFNKIESQFLINFEILKKEEIYEMQGESEDPNSQHIPEKKEATTGGNAVNESNLIKTKETFEEWQKYLKTNLQEFYHKLSGLRNLKNLDLSNNKIHFFDIDPFFIHKNDGFAKLRKLDLSNNIIEEEIAVLLVLNVPNLEWLNIINNPIVNNKTAYNNIEFEIFKTKNILLAHLDKRKKKEKGYLIQKTKLNSFKDFDKKVKSKVNEMTEYRRKIEEDVIRSEMDYVDILQEDDLKLKDRDNIFPTRIENSFNKSSAADQLENILKRNSQHDNLFLTNNISEINNSHTKKISGMTKNKINTYDEFLSLAKKCYGKEIHYDKKQKVSLPMAYHRLRFYVNNLPTEAIEKGESGNYMRPTISRTLHLEKNVSDLDERIKGKKYF